VVDFCKHGNESSGSIKTVNMHSLSEGTILSQE
jgi:hypothetical protein